MRLLFFGSPAEVISPLRCLIESSRQGEFTLLGVVSQPARPSGRKKTLTDPPLVEYAKNNDIAVWQPEKASRPEFLEVLRELAPDVIITAAYGQILSEAFLSIPKRATINVHPSLLPAYRGATPVPAALLDGCEETGVSVLFTVKALDAGAIIIQKTFAIHPDECGGELTARLFEEGGPLLIEALRKLADPGYKGKEQDPSRVSLCQKIEKTAGEIAWNDSSVMIYRRHRAFHPWPGSYTHFRDQRIVIEQMRAPLSSGPRLAAGVFTFDKAAQALRVGTSDGDLQILRLKPAGSKSLDAGSFWNGARLKDSGSFS